MAAARKRAEENEVPQDELAEDETSPSDEEATGEAPAGDAAEAESITDGGGTQESDSPTDEAEANTNGEHADTAASLTDPGETAEEVEAPGNRILLVDDNAPYREAFGRHLILEGYDVEEGSNSQEALEKLAHFYPDLLITDLAMGTETEGLDLIREARRLYPLLPVIMISAVGTFEEGAEASRLGAAYVVSKMKIDSELPLLFDRIEESKKKHQEHRVLWNEIQGMRESSADGSEDDEEAAPDEVDPAVRQANIDKLQGVLGDDNVPVALKSEAFDVLSTISSVNERQQLTESMLSSLQSAEPGLTMEQVDVLLVSELSEFEAFDHDTKESLRNAEYLYNRSNQNLDKIDFSRNIGFSYCFAVENQAKSQLRRKLKKLVGSRETHALLHQLLEKDKRHMNLFYHQYLLQIMKGRELAATIDNVRQTFLGMLEHGPRYKPDGLKALGIIVMAFGRTYTFNNGSTDITIKNPLQITGLDDDYEVMDFAELLISLQHSRNPYIHPEISEMEKVSKLRQTTFDCLRLVQKLD
jgi:DNA-binding response OmpR family regulator